MLKVRVIPILTFNGISLVKTKQFKSPRIVGNPVQVSRVFNSRGVDELIFLDIYASKQNRKLNLSIVGDVIKECYMPVGIGGGISKIEDINALLRIGADKIVLKSHAINNPEFVRDSSMYFGSQCISVSVDVYKVGKNYLIYNDFGKIIHADFFVDKLQACGAGEIILNSVDRDGMMEGFDIEMFNFIERKCSLPIVCVGGGGNLSHYEDLFRNTNCLAVGSSSIFYYTQYTPLDIKKIIGNLGKPIRNV